MEAWKTMPYPREDIIITRYPLSETKQLTNIVYLMSDTIEQICNILGIDIAREDIIRSYDREQRGPTLLEELLIKEGKYSEEKARRNYISEQIVNSVSQSVKLLSEYGISTDDIAAPPL